MILAQQHHRVHQTGEVIRHQAGPAVPADLERLIARIDRCGIQPSSSDHLLRSRDMETAGPIQPSGPIDPECPIRGAESSETERCDTLPAFQEFKQWPTRSWVRKCRNGRWSTCIYLKLDGKKGRDEADAARRYPGMDVSPLMLTTTGRKSEEDHLSALLRRNRRKLHHRCLEGRRAGPSRLV